MQVLKAWKEDDGVSDGKSLRKKVAGEGMSGLVRASIQLATDAVAAVCAARTAAVVDVQPFSGSGALSILLQMLSFYFAINAGMLPFSFSHSLWSCRRLLTAAHHCTCSGGACDVVGQFEGRRRKNVSACAAMDALQFGKVIGGTLATGMRADAMYRAVEELAGGRTGKGLLARADPAIISPKIILALNSVRLALKVRSSSLCLAVVHRSEVVDSLELATGTWAALPPSLVSGPRQAHGCRTAGMPEEAELIELSTQAGEPTRKMRRSCRLTRLQAPWARTLSPL